MHPSILKKLRPLLPFPRRSQWQTWFPSFETRNLGFLLARHKIDLIIDIGANRGQFRDRLRAGGYKGDILSIEPSMAEHQLLEKRAKGDANWIIAPRAGLGRQVGEMKLIVPADTSLSSFLPHKDARIIGSLEAVPVDRLDNLFRTHSHTSSRDIQNLMIKIDVQGFEMEVIAGGPEALQTAKCCFLELACLPSYEGEASYLELLTQMDDLGFVPVFWSPVLRRHKLGYAHAVDVFLVRRDALLY